ncbi:MAG: circadian clock protein KaiC [Bacteroidota bacterium]
MDTAKQAHRRLPLLRKSPTGIAGLDEITGGGLPTGRPTLVCGAAGCGKTLFAIEFLVHGAVDYGEPGVFVAFEENARELAENVASLGFDIEGLIREKKLFIEYVRIERSEIEEAGEYDLEALFIRLASAIDRVGARRIALDTVETLFGALPNPGIVRAELKRLFRWLKDKGMTAVITAERGEGKLTRHGLEEYVADCVILLDHRVHEQISTRRLRIVKYRGSLHGTNEYPFLIGKRGISVLPITSVRLEHRASSARISTGIKTLDRMLGGKGYYRGSSVLLTGTAGTGKTSIAAAFVEAACRRGERAVYFAFEESPSQFVRNMRSIGIDLKPHVESGALCIQAGSPTTYGLEMHLLSMHSVVEEFDPAVVVLDPITDFADVGTALEIKAATARIVNLLKGQGITALFTSLTTDEGGPTESVVGISSVIDTWISMRNLEVNGERQRGLYILKSRGMPHSNQIHSFVLSNEGIQISPLDQAGNEIERTVG